MHRANPKLCCSARTESTNDAPPGPPLRLRAAARNAPVLPPSCSTISVYCGLPLSRPPEQRTILQHKGLSAGPGMNRKRLQAQQGDEHDGALPSNPWTVAPSHLPEICFPAQTCCGQQSCQCGCKQLSFSILPLGIFTCHPC